jgi:hypothetical protein
MTPFTGFTHLRPLDGARLEVGFAGEPDLHVVDVAALVGDDPLFAPLRDPAVFARAHLVAGGTGVAWTDELDVCGDVVWWAVAAARGEVMPEGAFAAWRARHGLSLSEAARALGLSRRQVAYYDSGQKPVPRTVMLACRGWEADRAA